MDMNKMVIFTTAPNKVRFCIRNQYSDFFNDFDLLRFGRTFFQERIEYKFGFIGIQFVLMIFKRRN
jgi:hypothetical protein